MAYQRRRHRHHGRSRRQKHGKIFRTRAGRLGCYVYKNGIRVGFKAIQSGAKRYIADKTYRYARKRWG